ncbi:hypothetical protein QYF36_023297 [Acer negundo]|nr:hypothetical protein QYF36_023297 [Acer negundo]
MCNNDTQGTRGIGKDTEERVKGGGISDDVLQFGHATMECLEGHDGSANKTREELPFGFWLKATAPVKKWRFWGKRPEPKYDTSGGRRFDGNKEFRTEALPQALNRGKERDAYRGKTIEQRMQSSKEISLKGKGIGSEGEGSKTGGYEDAIRKTISHTINDGGMFVFKGTLTNLSTQVAGDVCSGILNANLPTDNASKDIGSISLQVDSVQNTSKMKSGTASADDVSRGNEVRSAGVNGGTRISKIEKNMVISSINASRNQGSAGSWKRRARGAGVASGQHEVKSQQGKNDGMQDNSILGKQEVKSGGVSNDKRQRLGTISEDNGLHISDLSMGRSLTAYRS